MASDIKIIEQLYKSVQDGCKERVHDILQSNHDVVYEILNRTGPERGYYYLHEACKRGHEEVVTLLTSYYEQLDQPSPQAPLPDPVPESCDCPFFTVTYNGWVDILDVLLKYKSDVFKKIRYQVALLNAACYGGKLNTVTYCVERIQQIPNSWLSPECLTPFLDAACQVKHIGIIHYLMMLGAKLTVDIIDKYPETIGKVLESSIQSHCSDNSSSDQQMDEVIIGWASKNLSALHPMWLVPYAETLTELDLSSNDIQRLPDVVPWQLENLKKLDVSSNQLHAFMDGGMVGKILCIRLRELNLSHNHLTELPPDVFCLPALEYLNASHNKLVHLARDQTQDDDSNDLEMIPSHNSSLSGGLSQWYTPGDDLDAMEGPWSTLRTLDLSNNQLEVLPPQLALCANLVVLRLAQNRLRTFPAPWCCPLRELDLSENFLMSLACSLEDYWGQSLKKLRLTHNILQEISQSVCRLASLKELDLSCNKLRCLPNTTWWECEELEMFNLSHNRLTNSTTPIARQGSTIMKRLLLRRSSATQQTVSTALAGSNTVEFPLIFANWLTDLDLSHNQLSHVPLSVCDLKTLQRLDVSYNERIHHLPYELGTLLNCYDLGMVGLTLKDIPHEIYTGGVLRSRDVLAYLKVELRRSESYQKIKLMVVGKASKGKSTLVEALRGKSPPPNISTNGIVIREMTLSGQSMRKKMKAKNKDGFPDITFQMWDFAGQSDYYVTHKIFLSPAAIYLLVFDLRLHKMGVASLRQWLLDIQAHAPNSYVVIVGTFLDCLTKVGRENITALHEEIRRLYGDTFPWICRIVEVSGTTGEGVNSLVEAIYTLAASIEDRRTSTSGQAGKHRKLIGRKVPRSYLDLEKLLLREAKKRKKENELPIMTHEEFSSLVSLIPKNDINTPEELTLASRFLTEAGVLLHYSQPLHGLNTLYFIDPSWLAQLLAKFISMHEVHRSVKEGILPMEKAHSLLFSDAPFQKVQLTQYIQLLEKFEVALQLDKERLLIPSKLSNRRPDFSMGPSNVLYRFYKMVHTPSGFWSRLITRILVMVQQFATECPAESENKDTMLTGQCILMARLRESHSSLAMPTSIYWQEGIHITYNEFSFCVESANHYSTPGSPDLEGVVISTYCPLDEHLLLGFVVDQIDSLIEEWFPGLDVIVDYNNPPTQRLVPCPHCVANSARDHCFEDVHMFPIQDCAMAILKLSQLSCQMDSTVEIDASTLVPDLLLNDLPPQYFISHEQDVLEFDPNTELLGRGGEGSVYRGLLNGARVAVKQHHTFHWMMQQRMQSADSSKSSDNQEGTVASQTTEGIVEEIDNDIENTLKNGTCNSSTVAKAGRNEGKESNSNRPITDSHEAILSDDSDPLYKFHQNRLLQAFQQLRQEVGVLSRLRHPCLVSLLRVDTSRLCFVLEYAPLGSLRSVLDTQLDKRVGTAPRERQPSVLGRMLTYKLVLQMTAAIGFLHSQRIIYKDLKCDNILVWSTNVDDRVNIKISDYGLSRYYTPQGLTGSEGTPGYQAPEMMTNTPYNEKVDIFALGMTTYEMVTGHMPFSKLSSPGSAVQKYIEEGRRPSLEDWNIDLEMPAMETLLSECWQTDPCDRPTALEVLSRLSNASFPCHLRTLPTIQQRVLPHVCLAWVPEHQDTRQQQYVRLWTGRETTRSYHVLNASHGVFKVRDEPHGGAAVTCMTMIGHTLLLGNMVGRSLLVRSV
ncbi:Leucine-rich repeat serine/threonine-protein kinase 1 [Lamellibrachia satsuma]|nr:Leucine-rich repeat serine/threonine-protein kinase 1 [Lamellibrachia satsuma]